MNVSSRSGIIREMDADELEEEAARIAKQKDITWTDRDDLSLVCKNYKQITGTDLINNTIPTWESLNK